MSDVVTFGSLPIGARIYPVPVIDGETRGVITITHEKIADDLAQVDEPVWCPIRHGDVVHIGADVLVSTMPMEREMLKARLRLSRARQRIFVNGRV